MSNFAEKYSFSGRESALGRWVTEAIGLPGMRLRSQLRGNDLRLLCEGQPGPRKADVLLRLIPALQRVDLSTLVPAYHPKIYRVQIFGRLTGQQEPIWQALLHLDQLDRHLEQLKRSLQLSPELVFAAVQTGATAASPTRVPIQSPTSRTPLTDNPFQLQEDAELTLDTQAQASRTLEDREAHSEAAALALSNRALAKQGNEYAIALYLSDALSRLGVAVQASAKTLPYTPPAAVHHAEPEVAIDQWSTKRLWIICEAPYSPEASLLSETITAKLRELEIEGFRDAVILFRVLGEAQPDWMLRVVLTPPSEMLRDWARWGDVEAIQRLLNQELQPLGVQVSNAILNATTLHLSCGMVQQGRSAFKAPDRSAPDQQQLKAEIALFLEALAPQGIHAATIYGQVWKQESPAWVDWLTLPASLHPALSESAMELAQQRDWGAIAFLLHRLLNPDLDEYLATGGVRLQLLPKQDLLHIMCEAFVCPSQQQICDAITHLLQPLNLVDIAGIRIYGRRSGEKQPLWKHGVDFVARDRLVPEASPEFAVTASYVNDLIHQSSEAALLKPEPMPTLVQPDGEQARRGVVRFLQTVLTRSQLFDFLPEAQTQSIALPGQISYRGTRVALVWGTIGLLLTVQGNWLLTRWLLLQPPETTVANVPAQPAPEDSPAIASAALPEAPQPTTSASPSPTTSPNSAFPNIRLNPAPETNAGTEGSAFNPGGFTQLPSPTDTAKSPAPAPKGSISTVRSADETEMTNLPALPYTRSNLEADLETAARIAQIDFPTFNSRQLDEKLQLYGQYLDRTGRPPDVLIVGSSRALRGIDPVALEQALADLGHPNLKVFNFGINGATAQVVDLLLRQFLTPEQLPRMIVWADGARALNGGTLDITYNGIVASAGYREMLAGSSPIPQSMSIATTSTPRRIPSEFNRTLTQSYEMLDRWVSQQLGNLSGIYLERDRLKNLLQQQVATVTPQNRTLAIAELVNSPTTASPNAVPNAAQIQPGEPLVNAQGFLSLPLQFNPASYYQKYARVAGAYDGDYDNFQVTGVQQNALNSLLDYTQEQKIPVVFVNLPLTDEYLDPVRLQHEATFQQSMVSLSLNRSNAFTFRDFSDKWIEEYRYFSDPSHLNRYGAYAMARQLAEDPLIPWVKTKDQ